MMKNIFRMFRRPETFSASASPEVPQPPALPIVKPGFTASTSQDIAAKVIGSYRYRTALPAQRAAMLRHAADSVSSVPAASVTPLRSGPARVAPRTVQKTAPTAQDWAKLSRDAESLVALADRVFSNVRQEKARALSSLPPLDRTAIAIRAQLESDAAGPMTADVATKIARKSKPSVNPAFVPLPNRDVRLRESNTYYSELATETDAEIERARLAGKIPQELLARRRRIDADWLRQNNNILSDK